MSVFVAYACSLVGVAGYVCWKGGNAGRASMAALLVGSVASQIVYMMTAEKHLPGQMLIVDSLILATQVIIALNSKKTWPIWVAAFQLNTVLADLAIFVSVSRSNKFYYILATIWAVPTLVVIAMGVWRDNSWTQRTYGLADAQGHFSRRPHFP